MISIDERISELQTRLQRKRLANQQLASQISNTTLQKQKQTQDLTLRYLFNRSLLFDWFVIGIFFVGFKVIFVEKFTQIAYDYYQSY